MIKKTLLTALPFMVFGAVCAQQAAVTLSGAGVSLVSAGAPVIVLNDINLVNNTSATAVVPGGSTVKFLGTAASSSIGGAYKTPLFNLEVDKAGRELVLRNDISVRNKALLTAGNVNLTSQRLDLLNTGYIEGEVYPNGNRFYSADDETGEIRAERVVSIGANNNIAGLQLDLSVSGGNAPGNSVIIRGHNRQSAQAFQNGEAAVARYYDIAPTSPGGYTYAFTFRYHEQELDPTVGENNFTFFRSASYGSNSTDWEEWGASTAVGTPGYPSAGLSNHNAATNTVTLTGINTFSRWTLSKAKSAWVNIEENGLAGSNSLSVYPNPAEDFYTVSISVHEYQGLTTLALFDMTGKQVFQSNKMLFAGKNEFSFSRNGLPAGTYFLKVSSENRALSPIKVVLN